MKKFFLIQVASTITRGAHAQRGENSQLISGSEFEPGIYLYALIADGQEVDVKRMILTE
jgi:hypothetical protein